MTFEIRDEADEPRTTGRAPMMFGLAAAVVCALFLAVVVIPPSRGPVPAPITAPTIEPQPHSGAAPARTAPTLTIVSAPQDGIVARLCGDAPVFVPVPPSSEGPSASVAPVVGRAVNVPLTTYIYDRGGERLLYTLDDPRGVIATGAVPDRTPNATIAIEGWRVWIDGRAVIGIQPGPTSRYALCPRALDLLPKEAASHPR